MFRSKVIGENRHKPICLQQKFETIFTKQLGRFCLEISEMKAIKVARLDFLGGIPPKFERQLCPRKLRYGKKVTTAVLYKDDTFL